MGKQAQALVERSGHEANPRITGPPPGVPIGASPRAFPGRRRAERLSETLNKTQRPVGHTGLAGSACCRRAYVVERETGFEPATSTLARLHSTTELLPQMSIT